MTKKIIIMSKALPQKFHKNKIISFIGTVQSITLYSSKFKFLNEKTPVRMLHPKKEVFNLEIDLYSFNFSLLPPITDLMPHILMESPWSWTNFSKHSKSGSIAVIVEKEGRVYLHHRKKAKLNLRRKLEITKRFSEEVEMVKFKWIRNNWEEKIKEQSGGRGKRTCVHLGETDIS